MSPPRVAPSLFDLVARQAKSIARHGVDDEEVVTETTPLIVFCLNFYRQVFKSYEVDVAEPSAEAWKRVATLRAKREKEKAPTSEVQLIGWFEEFCARYPDLTELVSPDRIDEEESHAVRDFYEDYMVIFLDRIISWSKSEKDKELLAKVTAVREMYVEAIESQ